jgi:hypothetical protein
VFVLDKNLPLGVQLHNPTSIRPGDPWDGLDDPPFVEVSTGKFCHYKDNVFGFRAACKNLKTWFNELGLDTITKIIHRQAPSTENNTAAYIQRVCSITGWGADDILKPRTYEHAWKLIYAMTTVECGSFEKYFKKWELDEGLRRAGFEDVPTTPLHKNVSAVGSLVSTAGTAAVAAHQFYQSNEPLLSSFSSKYVPLLFIGGAALCIFVNELVKNSRQV